MHLTYTLYNNASNIDFFSARYVVVILGYVLVREAFYT
jgi:hypothetical protein